MNGTHFVRRQYEKSNIIIHITMGEGVGESED